MKLARVLVPLDGRRASANGETGPPREIAGSVVERVIHGTRRLLLAIRSADAAVETPRGEAFPIPNRPEAAQRAEHRPKTGGRYLDVAHSGAGFPTEVSMAGRAIDASTWPTARELADTLAGWHATAEMARTEWARLPTDARSNIPSPP